MPVHADTLLPLKLADDDPTLLDLGSALDTTLNNLNLDYSTFSPKDARNLIDGLRSRRFEMAYDKPANHMTIERGEQGIDFRLVAVPGTEQYRPKYGATFPDYETVVKATEGFYPIFRKEVLEVYREIGLLSEEELQEALDQLASRQSSNPL